MLLSCNYQPDNKNMLCINKKDAIKVAEKEWRRVYGNSIDNKKPFIAELKVDSIWVIQGTLPDDFDGGVPYAEINAKTCEIIEITHGK